jgi:hypothetical protein
MRAPIGIGEIAAQCYLDGKRIGMDIKRTAQWEIRCLAPKCHYTRGFGTAQYEAKRAADAHQRRRPTHRVQVWMLAEDRDPHESLAPLDEKNLETSVDTPPY